ncbi:IS630 family transposase [Legionella anisa]|uniref:IS630 family transposase n=1 Tax=Legionella anisa TaxID=28082 RepID=UPI0010410C64|nr:IS630 family transposase [Legionella anisa]
MLAFWIEWDQTTQVKRIKLTTREKERLELRHQQSNDGKERDRIKAVLLRCEGWTAPMIAQALRIHESTIIRHLNDYRESKLKPENGGSESRLDEEMTAELIAHLEQHTYHQVQDIADYIDARWSIKYSVPGLNKWLHRNGFSYKKPKGVPYKADEQLQKNFIKKYRRLKTVSGGKEPILFMDSVHPSQATKLSHGWIRTGETKQVETSASRTRMNLIGVIKLNDLASTIVREYDTINAQSIIEYLRIIRSEYKSGKRIHLILDRAGYHRAKEVKKEAKKLNIKLHYLPAYSPNLNPIERLWKVMNEKVRNNRFFKSAKDFKQAILDFFDTILPNIADSLDQRINDNFEILKVAS